jgi:hypothetical protein
MSGVQKLSWDATVRRDGAFGLVSTVPLGQEDDPGCPAIHRVKSKPGQVAARHAHPGWALTIIVSGSATIGGDDYGPGDLLLAEPLAQYGPLVPGPDGVETIEVFESDNLINPIWDDPNDPLALALWESIGGNPYASTD